MSETGTISHSNRSEESRRQGMTAREALERVPDFDQRRVVAAKVDGTLVDLNALIDGDLKVEPVTIDSPEGIEIVRHTTSHVMAQAVKELFEGTKLAIGPTIKDGFYYDFDTPHPFTPDDLKAIEKRMKEIIKRKLPVAREEMGKEEVLKAYGELGEVYKDELIRELSDETVSIYRQGDFFDLCRGPHLPSTGWIKAFKLTGTAGAYWRGSEKNKMLCRIYGTAFPAKEALKAHLEMLEEAKRRDHRRLGRELDLFSIDDDIGSGLVLWHPKGAMVRGLIEDFWKGEHLQGGYHMLYSPHVAKIDLWGKSGHLDFYRENMFSPMDLDGQEYVAKPMNCPFHIKIFQSHVRSYRELPIRYAELGTVYRYERSGVLHGLLRVRGFTQDDAHIFCRLDQLESEIESILDFTLYILRSFGFNEFDIFLSTRPEKYVGSLDNWEKAEGTLRSALEKRAEGFTVDPGEGVFYGPKIDIKIKDSLGRSWQCSTIQVDFNLPERFDVSYRESDGTHQQPIMIHRALMGSLERFFGCLVEHYAGAFPLWLAPVQAKILTVTGRSDEYAGELFDRLREGGIRVELDERNEKLGLKIREAQLNKIPYMLIIGDKEVAERNISVRVREGGETSAMGIEDFMKEVQQKQTVRG
ncbi:MAG: threonine--tRNA ligase [Deltaproteobacteria bacterium]|nr:threonine--tRNA ligase [Deltaproteobacteria bacterium]